MCARVSGMNCMDHRRNGEAYPREGGFVCGM